MKFDVFDDTYQYRCAALLPYVHQGLYSGAPQNTRVDDVIVFAAVDPEKTEFDRIRKELSVRGLHVTTRDLILSLDRMSGKPQDPIARTGKWHVAKHAWRMHKNVRAVLKWNDSDVSLNWIADAHKTIFRLP